MNQSVSFHKFRIITASVSIALLGPIIPLASNGTVILLAVCSLSLFHPKAVIKLIGKTSKFFWLGFFTISFWMLITNWWTPEPNILKTFKTILVMAGGVCFASGIYFLKRDEVRILNHSVGISIVIMTIIFVTEYFSNGFITKIITNKESEQAIERLSRGIVFLGIIILPYTIYQFKRLPLLCVILFCIATAIILVLPMTAIILGLISGIIISFVTYITNWRFPAVVAFMFSIYIFTSPLLSTNLLTIQNLRSMGIEMSSSSEHRIGIWSHTSKKIKEFFPLGSGFDSARILGREKVYIEEMRKSIGYAPPALPLHPHNGILQVWLELGIIGSVGIFFIIIGILKIIEEIPAKKFRSAALGAFVTALAPLLLNFGLWQAWWLSTLCISFALILSLRKEDKNNY